MKVAPESTTEAERERTQRLLEVEYAVKAAAKEWSIRKAMREERAAGVEIGREEGVGIGREEGVELGRVTQARMVLRLLQRKFGALPEDTEARVLRGDSGDLGRWCERILDAPSLDDVFAFAG
jgi:hypothetical protein